MKRNWVANVTFLTAGLLLLACDAVFASGTTTATTTSTSGAGISSVANNVITNLSSIAKLITAGSYVAGFAFAVAAIVKFKAHKDNPTQIMISQPIALLFVAAALIFIPSVFKTTGATLFGSGTPGNSTSGVSSF